MLVECAADRRKPDDAGRSQLLDRRDEVGDGRVALRERALIVVEGFAVRRDEPLAVEQRDPRPHLGLGHALVAHGLHQEIRRPDRGRARAQEQEALQREGRAGDAKRTEDPGEGDRGGALHVVVETADALAVALEETDRTE